MGYRPLGQIERTAPLREYVSGMAAGPTGGMVFGNPCSVSPSRRCSLGRDEPEVGSHPDLQPFADLSSTKTHLSVAASRAGLPWHNHEASWEAIVTGEKLFLLHPPVSASDGSMEDFYLPSTADFVLGEGLEKHSGRIMHVLLKPVSGSQILVFCQALTERALGSQGDIIFVPCNWWHATLNIGEVTAMASTGRPSRSERETSWRHGECAPDAYQSAQLSMEQGISLIHTEPEEAADLLERGCATLSYHLACNVRTPPPLSTGVVLRTTPVESLRADWLLADDEDALVLP